MKYLINMACSLIFFINLANAQCMYEYCYSYTYAGGYTENYKALIVRNEDGQGFIRLKFTYPKDNQERLFDLGLQEYYDFTNPGQPVDSTKIVLDGYDPQLIKGPAYTFYNECFLIEYDFSTGQYLPTGVRREIRNPNGNYFVYGKINYIRHINESDMTKEFVSQYFDEKDEIYQNLFNQQALINETRGMTVPDANTVKMHLIFVANTNDGKIGKTCEIDKDKITARFSSIAKWLKMSFDKTIIYGDDYNVDNVMKAVNNVPMGSNDICIFYYSGHGFNYEKAEQQYPFLDLRDNDMDAINNANTPNIEMIYNRLVAKNYRLTLVVSDCCNNDIGLTMVPSKTEITMRPSTTSFSLRNGYDLFLNKERKSYLFTASSKGELSAGNGIDGGIFSHNFRETLEYYLGNFKSNVTWEDIWKVAKEETIKKAVNSDCFSRQTNTTYKCRQTPVSPIDKGN
jgi:Caspase domain